MAKNETHAVVSDLINFLNASPTAFHAVGKTKTNSSLSLSLFESSHYSLTHSFQYDDVSDEAKKRLLSAGFTQLSEREVWELEPGNKYFFTRNHSTIVAFAIGQRSIISFFCHSCYGFQTKWKTNYR